MVEGTPGMPYGIAPTPLENALKFKSNLEYLDERIDEIALDGGLENGSGSSSPKQQQNDPSSDGEAQANNNDTSPLHMFAFFKNIEENMRLRRKEVMALLKPNEAILSISSFPRSGTFDSCAPPTFVNTVDGTSKSLFFPDDGNFNF